jgi:hypothetical protein
MFVLESRMLCWRRGKKGGGEENYEHQSKLVVNRFCERKGKKSQGREV